MKRSVSCLLLCLVVGFSPTCWSQNKPILDVNYKNLASRADLHYDKPVTRSEEGMPIGNGVMGSLVWTTPSLLHLQLNRVDVFANNSASNNFYERHTDYCGGVGFVDIDAVDPDVFNTDFDQHLSCFDGIVTTKSKGLTFSTFASQMQDVIVININDKRANPLPIIARLRALRNPTMEKGDHRAISTVKVVDNRIILTQEFREGKYYCGTAVILEMAGRQNKASFESESSVRISAVAGNQDLTVYVASAASFDPADDLVAIAGKKLKDAASLRYDGLLEANQNWWSNFWNKSFVYLHSTDGTADFIEQHYTYYLYVMASSSRGQFPTKFNGMLWTTGGDAREWGSLFWGANQSCLYTALPQTNHFELMDPMFNMYSSNFDDFATAAQQQWGSKGIYIPEAVSFDGIEPLPDDIASEMRDLYLQRKPWAERSRSFMDYSYAKLPFISRWNWKKDDGWKDGIWHTTDKGGGPYGHLTHIFSRGAKIAYQYWLKYEYTQDIEWLKQSAYPVIKGVVEFYRNFPNVKKERDGKYHIYHVNDNESVWGGHNTVEEISSMMAIFPVAIRASELLQQDAELRTHWKEFFNNLSPLPLSTDYDKDAQKVTWVRSLPPIVQGNGNRRPDSNTMPAWFFDLCSLEADERTLEIANMTYDAYFPPGIEDDGINEKARINVLSKLPVSGAVLGRAESTRYLLPNQIRTAEIPAMANRMDLREGFQTTSIQRLGRAADALLMALCQGVPASPGKDPVIRVFPAWPPEWDAQYRLLVRGGFMVSSSMKDSVIEFVEIESLSGSECRIRNPWKNQNVSIFRNGKPWKKTTADLITFSTKANEKFVIVLASTSLPKATRMILAD